MKKLILAITLIAATHASAKAFCLKQYMRSQNRAIAMTNNKTNFFNVVKFKQPALVGQAVNKRK